MKGEENTVLESWAFLLHGTKKLVKTALGVDVLGGL